MMFDKENVPMHHSGNSMSGGLGAKKTAFGSSQGGGNGVFGNAKQRQGFQGTSNPIDELRKTILNARSHDMRIRGPAEKKLKEFEERAFPQYLQGLCCTLADEKCPADARQLAGLCLKNTLTAKSEQRQKHLEKRWLMLEDRIRTGIRGMILNILGAQIKGIRSTAAQVVASIASIEIPRGKWSDAVDQLVGQILSGKGGPNMTQSCFEALGYVCDNCSSHLKQKADKILHVISKGMAKDQQNITIKLAATTALANSLELAADLFEDQVKRRLIFEMIFAAAGCADGRVRMQAFQCLVEVAEKFYHQLNETISHIFNLTSEAIQGTDEDVAQMAIEFWTTVSETECTLIENEEDAKSEGDSPPSERSLGFMAKAAKQLTPLLLKCLTKQNDHVDDDTYNVAIASGICLTWKARTVRDNLVPLVLPFIHKNIRNRDWRLREAATMAFGCILDGPDKDKLKPLVTQALEVLLSHLSGDKNDVVKDTAAWTVGRVCELVPEVISKEILQHLMRALIKGLSETPKVANNVCWAIHNLADGCDTDGEEIPTSPLSPYFEQLLGALLKSASRPDSDEANLLSSSYECINVLIRSAAKDKYPVVVRLIGEILNRLASSVKASAGRSDGRSQIHQNIQALLCGTLQTIIQKVPLKLIGEKKLDQCMHGFLAVLKSESAQCHEEALLAIDAVVMKTGQGCYRYMAATSNFLFKSLANVQETRVCAVAVGLSADIARALKVKISPICDNLVRSLLVALQAENLDRSVKPRVTSTFGDIALSIGGHFTRYLKIVVGMLSQMGKCEFPEGDDEDLEFLDDLREAILGTYTGILQGLSEGQKDRAFLEYVNDVFLLVHKVGQDPNSGKSVLNAAIGVVGDVAQCFKRDVKKQLSHPQISVIVERGRKHSNAKVKQNAQWAYEMCTAAVR